MTDVQFFDRNDGERIAYRKIAGAGPGVLWVGGFRSSMAGTKAAFLADWALRRGRAALLYDHFAQGLSSGDFAKATIDRWRDDCLAVVDTLCQGPQIVVASSMGGWISNLLVRARPARIAAVVWLAPAPDFTEDLMWDLLPEAVQREILETGSWQYRSETDCYPITKALIDSGRRNLVLDKPLAADFPIRILHGMADAEVPWRRTLKLVAGIAGDVQLAYVKNGGHRLSAPGELKALERTLDALIEDLA